MPTTEATSVAGDDRVDECDRRSMVRGGGSAVADSPTPRVPDAGRCPSAGDPTAARPFSPTIIQRTTRILGPGDHAGHLRRW